MKKYQKAKLLLERKAQNINKKPIYATRKLSIGLVSCMLGLVMAMPVAHAEDLDISQIDSYLSDIEDEAEDEASEEVLDSGETSDKPLPLVDDEANKTELGGLETKDAGELDISTEYVPEVVRQIDVKAPSVNSVFYDDTTISGAKLAKYRDKVNRKTIIATVHVILKDSGGNEKANLSVTPKSGTTWEVKLPEGKKVEKGDTVTVYQQIGEDKSPEVTAKAQESKASTVTLTMPTGEIWIEQTSSNIVNEAEQAEAVKMFNNKNAEIASDIESVKFSIIGKDHAYYEVTYTDGSTSGKIEATNLQIKQVTDYSRKANFDEITIADNVIKGKLAGEAPFKGMKVQLVLKVNKNK